MKLNLLITLTILFYFSIQINNHRQLPQRAAFFPERVRRQRRHPSYIRRSKRNNRHLQIHARYSRCSLRLVPQPRLLLHGERNHFLHHAAQMERRPMVLPGFIRVPGVTILQVHVPLDYTSRQLYILVDRSVYNERPFAWLRKTAFTPALLEPTLLYDLRQN